MRLLADENVDRAVVEWLRSRPLDVAWIAELDPGASDQSVGALAILEARVLITFDRDFGEMVFRHGLRLPGVLFARPRAARTQALVHWFANLWPQVEPHLPGNFVIASPSRLRVRPIEPFE